MSLRATGSKAAFALALLLTGCARTPRAPETLPPPSPMDGAEVSALLGDLTRHGESVRRYQGLLGVRGRGPEGGFDARLAIFFERPDRVRVELLTPFGGTKWSAVASREEITAFFPGKPGARHYLREPDVADVVGRLLGLRLRGEDIMAALSGTGVSLETATPPSGYRRGARRFLELGTPARLLELGDDGQVVSAQGEGYRVSYPSPWKRRGRSFPDELVIENENVRARLETDDVDVGVALDPETFVLEIPPDAVRLRPAEVGSESMFVVGREPS